jgi:hypothetical protein
MKLDRPNINTQPTFMRYFVCFEAMSIGFVEGCRPFIGVDRCHLKGKYGGIITLF